MNIIIIMIKMKNKFEKKIKKKKLKKKTNNLIIHPKWWFITY